MIRSLDGVKKWLVRSMVLYVRTPPDTEFQRGYLACLRNLRDQLGMAYKLPDED